MMTVNRSRARLIAAALLLVAFVAGAAAGVIADRLARPPRPIIMTRMKQDMSGVLDKLSLTPEQRAQAEAIIQRSSPRTEAVMREVAERLRGVSDSVDAELRAVLTPEQHAKLDSLRPEPRLKLLRKQGNVTRVDTVYPTPPSGARPR